MSNRFVCGVHTATLTTTVFVSFVDVNVATQSSWVLVFIGYEELKA
jgi:hypothetical protein